MDEGEKVLVSGAVALPGVAAVLVWLACLVAPPLLYMGIILVVVCASLLSLPVAAVWRWRAGGSWHANGAILAALIAQPFNCAGFLYSLGRAVAVG